MLKTFWITINKTLRDKALFLVSIETVDNETGKLNLARPREAMTSFDEQRLTKTFRNKKITAISNTPFASFFAFSVGVLVFSPISGM